MPFVKLNTKTGPIIINPDHIIYIQALAATNQTGPKFAGSRINFSIATKHEKRDAHLVDVIETPTVIEQMIARAK